MQEVVAPVKGPLQVPERRYLPALTEKITPWKRQDLCTLHFLDPPFESQGESDVLGTGASLMQD